MPLPEANRVGRRGGFLPDAAADAGGQVNFPVASLGVHHPGKPGVAEAAQLVGPDGLFVAGAGGGMLTQADIVLVAQIVGAGVQPVSAVEGAAGPDDARGSRRRHAVGRRVELRAVLERQRTFLKVIDHVVGRGGAERQPDAAVGAPGQRGRGRRIAPVRPDGLVVGVERGHLHPDR